MVILFYKWTLFLAALLPYTSGSSEALAARNLHPFYVSVIEINYNNADKNLEIACKIFTDDFESTLNSQYKTKIDLFNTKDSDREAAGKLMLDYISKHLIIDLDGKRSRLEFVGFERETEAIWSYYQVSNVNAPGKMGIDLSILYDAFEEQINLLHVTVNGKRKSQKLNNPATRVNFQF